MAGRSSQPEADERNQRRPEVIVEFLFDRGLIHLCVRNIGEGAANDVSVTFDKKVVGLGGSKDVSALPVFKNISFLGPGREIVVFVDESHSYFARKQPTRISVTVAYRGSNKQKYETTINHDLGIYRDLPYVALTEGISQGR
jgi:hypothetical protein